MSSKQGEVINVPTLKAKAAGRPYDENIFARSIIGIAEVVVRQHYPTYCEADFDDRVQIGVCRILEMYQKDKCDPSKNLMSFLYTVVRNRLSNLYKIESRQRGVEKHYATGHSVIDEVKETAEEFKRVSLDALREVTDSEVLPEEFVKVFDNIATIAMSGSGDLAKRLIYGFLSEYIIETVY